MPPAGRCVRRTCRAPGSTCRRTVRAGGGDRMAGRAPASRGIRLKCVHRSSNESFRPRHYHHALCAGDRTRALLSKAHHPALQARTLAAPDVAPAPQRLPAARCLPPRPGRILTTVAPAPQRVLPARCAVAPSRSMAYDASTPWRRNISIKHRCPRPWLSCTRLLPAPKGCLL